MKYFQLYIFCSINLISFSQIDSLLMRNKTRDSIITLLNMDAIYSRPFFNVAKSPVSIGGYTEANWQYLMTDGVTEGHQFQARRTTIFLSSTINKRLKFLTEIEFDSPFPPLF